MIRKALLVFCLLGNGLLPAIQAQDDGNKKLQGECTQRRNHPQLYNNDEHEYSPSHYNYRSPYDEEACAASGSISDTPFGSYLGGLSTCRFTFYAGETACPANEESSSSSTKAVVSRQGYVKWWPDECLYHSPRCYDVMNGMAIYSPYFCTQKWTIPSVTLSSGISTLATHMSVNCTLDSQKRTIERKRRVRDDILESVGVVLIWIVILVVCWCVGKRLIKEMRATARAHNEVRPSTDPEWTVLSLICCGYSCIIQKKTHTTRAERSALMNPSTEMHDGASEAGLEMT